MAPTDMKAHALHFLNLIGNKRDIDAAAKLIHPDCTFQHDDQPPKGRADFLTFWPQMMAAAPKFRVDVRDAVAEGGRVWVFSKVSNRQDGTDCDDLHMFEFDDEGMCTRSHGVHRIIQ